MCNHIVSSHPKSPHTDRHRLSLCIFYRILYVHLVPTFCEHGRGNMRSILVLACCLGAALIGTTWAQDAHIVYDKIYTGISDADPCVVTLDGTTQYGCTSLRGGSIGGLHLIDSDQAFADFTSNPPKDQLAVVLTPAYFNQPVLDKLQTISSVSAVLVARGTPPSSGFSPETTFPQQKWGLHADTNYAWNPTGNNMAYMTYSIPIFALMASSSADIIQKATSNRDQSAKYPRWGVQLDSFMSAAYDTETCLRRGTCLPIGGKSVWNTPGPLDTAKPIVLASAQLDSNAFFHGMAVGADANAASVAVLLASALSLLEMRLNTTELPNNLMFAFWGAESYGYSGTRRFVQDITQFHCEEEDGKGGCTTPFKSSLEFTKIKLGSILSMIELNQIGHPVMANGQPTLYLHQEKDGESDTLSQKLMQVSNNHNAGSPVAFTPVSRTSPTPGVPPSSTMSFLSKSKIPAIVITDHEEAYTNKYYHSSYDTSDTINTTALCASATLITRTLLMQANNGNPIIPLLANATHPYPYTVSVDDLSLSCNLIDQLFNCLATSFDCPLVKTVLASSNLQPQAQPSQYTGVFGYSPSIQLVPLPTKFLHDLLSVKSLTSSNGAACASTPECPSEYVCVSGQCWASTTFYHDALSPGFGWDPSKGWVVADASQPLYTESNWDATALKVYLEDDPVREGFFLAFGLIVIVLSFVGFFFLKRHFLKHYKLA
eukprot:TRINITY_DN3531_c0_g1_i6.p1 TRINITY_DN3531_c0_g1~~TRINITY_DN3531_c0_g1_i6.p1  ORF type:complete len:715 (-),score=165.08 TRINITY_DN3531_c0_g1_i6:47-2191(-)